MSNVFTSPLEAHPGTITAPSPFLGKHYREWNKALSKAQAGKHGFWLEQWQGLSAVCDIKLDGVPDDPSGDMVPYEVICWAVSCYTAYIRPLTDPKS